MNLKKAGLFVAVAAITCSFAQAETDDSGWYLGGNVGQSRARLDEQSIVNAVTPGFSNVIVNEDKIDLGYKLYTGYEFNRNLALEAGYFDLGEFNFDSITGPVGSLSTNMKIRGFNLDLIGRAPITDKFSAFARLGVNYALTQDTFNAGGAAAGFGGKLSERQANPKAGVGLEYAFNDAFSMRLEAERYRIDDAVVHKNNVDLYSVGFVYHFGAKPMPAPEPVVYTPPPPPAPAPAPVAPPAPRFEKYTLSSTELFGFDSANLAMPQPKLDQIATALKGEGAPQQIVITGYTDRLGAPSYNLKLSEQRANAVKNYLVKQGVDASRLITEGKGEADPVVQCDDKVKSKLIECLKPNRRVEIDDFKVVRKVQP